MLKKKKGLVYYDDLKFLLSKKINDEEIGSSPSPGFSLFTYKTSQHICTLGFEWQTQNRSKLQKQLGFKRKELSGWENTQLCYSPLKILLLLSDTSDSLENINYPA